MSALSPYSTQNPLNNLPLTPDQIRALFDQFYSEKKKLDAEKALINLQNLINRDAYPKLGEILTRIDELDLELLNPNIQLEGITPIFLEYLRSQNWSDIGGLITYCNSPEKLSVDLIRKMVRLGADVNFDPSDMEGPLFYALCYDRMTIAKLLLELGADPNKKNSYYLSMSTSHVACPAPRLFFLILNGAKITKRNVDIVRSGLTETYVLSQLTHSLPETMKVLLTILSFGLINPDCSLIKFETIFSKYFGLIITNGSFTELISVYEVVNESFYGNKEELIERLGEALERIGEEKLKTLSTEVLMESISFICTSNLENKSLITIKLGKVLGSKA